MAGFIELATLKASVIADPKGFNTAMAAVKKDGKLTAEEVEKGFKKSSKNTAAAMEAASKNIQKSLNMTEKEVKELTKSAENIYKDGFGKSANDVVKSLMQTKRAMGDIDSKELETATKRAMELRDTLGVKMSTSLKMAKQEMAAYGSTAEQAFDRVNKRLEQNQAAWGKLGAIGDKTAKLGMALTAGVTLPLLGLATAAGKTASDFESANAKIVSSLGLTEQQSAATKKAIQDIYSDGFGESIDDVAESIIQVKRQLGNIPDDQIKKVTENAIVLRDTLGQDMGESLRGVNSLMKNFGMTADDAMDLYVKGVQTGLDKTGELGDNLAEYGQLWSQAGFSAKEMFAVLDNGLKSGAYNLDKVNDFVKEFTISLSDGRIEKNLSSFSQGTRDIFAEFKKGGKTSQDVFKSVIGDLEHTTNQQDKLSLAGTVWSALGEDNAMKIIESLNDVNGTYDNVAGTMEKVKQQQNATFGSRFKSTLRDAQTALLPLGETLLNLAERYMPKIEKAVQGFSDTLSNLSEDDIDRILKIGGFVAIAGPTVVGLGKITKGITTVGGALKLGAGAMGLFESSAAAAGGAAGVGGLGASLVALAGPIALAVGGAAVVAGSIWAINKAYEASQATNWGEGVTKAQKSVLDNTVTLVNDTETKLNAYKNSYQTASTDITNNLKEIEEGIKKANQTSEKDTGDGIESLPINMQKQAKEALEKQKQANREQEAQALSYTQKVSDIMNGARQNERELTKTEKDIIVGITKDLSTEQVEALGLSAQKKAKMLAESSKTVEQMNGKERKAYIKSLDEIATQEDDSYKKRIKAAELFGKDSKQYQEVEKSHQEAMLEVYAKRVSAFKGDVNQKNALIAEYAQKSGVTVSDFIGKMSDLSETTSSKMSEVSKIVKKTGVDWASLDLDPKTGELTVKGREQLVATLLESKKWDKLSLKEKKLLVNGDEARLAFLNSLSEAGKWDQYKALEKELGADNSKAIQAIMEAKDGVNRWNSLQPADKEFLAKNDKLLGTVLASEGALQRYKDLPAAEQQLLANNQDLLVKVLQSEDNLNRWNQLQPADKEFLAKNEKLLNTVLSSNEALRRYNEFPPAEQEFLGNNLNLLNVIIGSEESLNNYKTLNPEEKQFVANNTDLINKVLTGTGSVDEFNRYPALMKVFNGVDATGQPVAFAEGNINRFNEKQVPAKDLNATDNASGKISSVTDQMNTLNGKKAETEIRTTHKNIFQTIYEKIVGGDKNAMGTESYRGGIAIVNDQKGSLYEELITLPNGAAFIPKGRDIMLPLPKGTRIDKASDTEKLRRGLPHFANGVNNQQPLPFVGYNATFKKQTASIPTSTKVVSNSPVININNPVWHSEKDLRKTLQDAAFILNIDERGALDG